MSEDLHKTVADLTISFLSYLQPIVLQYLGPGPALTPQSGLVLPYFSKFGVRCGSFLFQLLSKRCRYIEGRSNTGSTREGRLKQQTLDLSRRLPEQRKPSHTSIKEGRLLFILALSIHILCSAREAGSMARSSESEISQHASDDQASGSNVSEAQASASTFELADRTSTAAQPSTDQAIRRIREFYESGVKVFTKEALADLASQIDSARESLQNERASEDQRLASDPDATEDEDHDLKFSLRGLDGETVKIGRMIEATCV